jgi:hypothetical protein
MVFQKSLFTMGSQNTVEWRHLMLSDLKILKYKKRSTQTHLCRNQHGSFHPKKCNNKKRLGPCKQRELIESIVKDYDISVSRACKLTSLPRTMCYCKSQKDDTAVIEVLQDLAFKHPIYGFRKLFAYFRRSGNTWNHKRVYRIYKLLKLKKSVKRKDDFPQASNSR